MIKTIKAHVDDLSHSILPNLIEDAVGLGLHPLKNIFSAFSNPFKIAVLGSFGKLASLII